MKEIKTVTVVGATGVMGRNAAVIFASFGGAKVYCVSRNPDNIGNNLYKAVKNMRADCTVSRYIPVGYSELEDCVSKSDLVFESVAEDFELKKEIHKKIAKASNEDALYCTNTSGLSVNALAEIYPEPLRKRFFGVHLFNPPNKMTLCEFIPSKYSDKNIAADFISYLKTKLFRTAAVLKDTPAFLGNRICFQFLNEALIFSEKYKESGGIDYIDSILGTYTGIPSSPHITADFVGLDVHKAIVDNLFSNTEDFENDTFKLPQYVESLIKENRLGNKKGIGLYEQIKGDDGVTVTRVYDIKTGGYRDVKKYDIPFIEKMKSEIREGNYLSAIEVLIADKSEEANICLHFMLKYIAYSLYISKELGYTFDIVDDVCVEGLNRCPPQALYCLLSSVTDVRTLINERCPDIYTKYPLDSLFDDIKTSKYDYRKFFHSGRRV